MQASAGTQHAPQHAAERCPQCGESFRTLQELLFHVEAYHPDGRGSSVTSTGLLTPPDRLLAALQRSIPERCCQEGTLMSRTGKQHRAYVTLISWLEVACLLHLKEWC